MINKFINTILISAVFVLSLYLIEGACYRLVEPYAKWRLNFAWGDPDFARENRVLKNLPLDHFLVPPGTSATSSIDHSSLSEEFEFARRITSFNRPTRDRYYNFVVRQSNPLRNYEIMDFDRVKEVVLPGMRRPASSLDVELGLARREGLPVDYSKGLFIHVIPHGERLVYETQFARLESAFSFLLNHGIACVLLNPKTAEELRTQLKFLKAQYPNFSEKIFAYAEADAVKIIEDATWENDELLTSVIIKDPSGKISPQFSPSSWFLGILSKEAKNQEIHQSIIERVRLNRDNLNPYQARISGLILEDTKFEKLPLSSDISAYILNCLEFVQPAERTDPEISLESEPNNTLISNTSGQIEQNLTGLAITDAGGLGKAAAEPTFDCEVIREYRQLNQGDPEIQNVSNRELVLLLGASFEEMGDDMLVQIAERDPLFYTFYQSLREIEKSQK